MRITTFFIATSMLIAYFIIPLNGQSSRRNSSNSIFHAFYKLDLTFQQKMELRKIVQNLRATMRSKQQNNEGKAGKASRQTMMEERSRITRQAYDKALALLTDKQRLKLLDSPQDAFISKEEASGKTISLDLLRKVKYNASRAKRTTKLQPNIIDTIVKPADSICNDETFVRRVYVDLTGTTPTVEQILGFLKSSKSNKRMALIDELIDSPEFDDYQTMHWCDIFRVKSEFPIKLWPNGTAVYHRWIRNAVRTNIPYNEFVYQLVTASGSNFRQPTANFYRAVQETDPYSLSEVVALAFLGSRTETWTINQQNEIKKFFSNVAYKSTSEWKEEIVYWDRKEPATESAVLPDGTQVTLSRHRDPRRVFADWLTNEGNIRFAEVAVNRIWYWITGTGIVHEPDNFHPDNPPLDPELLAALADNFIKSDYNLKKLYRLITSSRTYQQKNPGYEIRPLDAETIQDTLCRIFGTTVSYSSDVPEPFSFYPKSMSTIAIPDGTITNPLLQTFGRPSRDTGRESDRMRTSTEAQRVFFINSNDINTWITKSWLLRALPLDDTNTSVSVQYLWLNILSRYPNAQEIKKAKEILSTATTTDRSTLQDLCWMLINTREFSSRH